MQDFPTFALMASKANKYQETEMIRVIVGIMAAAKGPFSKLMLVSHLKIVYPNLSRQELMNEISSALLTDKYCNNRFTSPKPGWWDLKKKANESAS